MRSLTQRQIQRVKWIVFLLSLLPGGRLIWAIYRDSLGANPIEFITRNTGEWTLYFLCATLALTPVRKWLGWHWLVRLRRMLGLYSFFYASVHFLTFLWFDHFFELTEMWQDVLKRPFIAVGFIAFSLLIPLALTSNQWMIRQLGGKQWQRLHQLVYVIVPLGVLHFFWMRAGKNLWIQPTLFAFGVAGLLVIRLFWSLRDRQKRESHN
ncbi:sulfite oxidase heme-binding subunit YedZ [Undibacterium fentianense]|uniref:Protein-methionine-sulfoxide reductase heme-binding subunit MsrQ n=1 Tax=Undibacterium fentianense TaxID=2828728 RepID=A0A941IDT3_9BURK|nr:protein-methionine-sulfoxide reductase heme-binding subunit MsrQ [Undibacterium fentianense]MBR7801649.1 sulfoxide reductase heme-binding subunit YedZ [Undibacterium fentianense]